MRGPRALLGILLMLTAAMVLAGTARIGALRIAGVATAIAVPPPPIARQCIVSPQQLRVVSHPGLPPNDGILPADQSLEFGSCTGPHLGEVVSVYREEPAPQAVLIYGFPFSFQISGCAQDVLRFLGIDPTRQGPVGNVGADEVNWAITTRAASVVARPSTDQSALGQRWVACLLGTPGSAYAGSAGRSYAGGMAPAALGVCGSRDLALSDDQFDRLAQMQPPTTLSHDPVDRTVPSALDCARPHQAEQFGLAWFEGRLPSTSALARSCTRLVASLTRMTDVTAGDSLAVRTVALRSPTIGPQWREVACTVVTTDQQPLNGTLVGVGDGVIPRG
jgi:hypothetical protein